MPFVRSLFLDFLCAWVQHDYTTVQIATLLIPNGQHTHHSSSTAFLRFRFSDNCLNCHHTEVNQGRKFCICFFLKMSYDYLKISELNICQVLNTTTLNCWVYLWGGAFACFLRAPAILPKQHSRPWGTGCSWNSSCNAHTYGDRT